MWGGGWWVSWWVCFKRELDGGSPRELQRWL